jgi:arylsulfatase A-like enzyme
MVGDLFDSLRESGELDDTYVFFTSTTASTSASTAWAPASGRPTRRT